MRKFLQKRHIARACVVAGVIPSAMLAAAASVEAGPLKTLHAFAVCADGKCRDGSAPGGNLVQDTAGNLYGTTAVGGKNNAGTIFQLTPDGLGGWKHSTIYSFCSEEGCADGENPQTATLIIDSEGSLYGTTQFGGEAEGSGVAFKLEHDADGWELIVIHNFCGADAPEPEEDCMGGATPAGGLTYAGAASGLPYNGESPLYGASVQGGEGEAGIVFELKPPKEKTPEEEEEWKVRELYVFCEAEGNGLRHRAGGTRAPEEEGNCDDGKMPSGNLLVDARGNLYGTTYFGGEDANYEGGGGVVFQLSRDHASKTWKQTVLYKFCSLANCRDGRSPHGGLTLDAAGNLFGATQFGGHNCNTGQFNCGVVFMISPNGENSVSRVLHAFCSADDCADGATPQGALAMDESGNLFGAALNGGKEKGGVVYKLQPDGKLRVLHSFCGTKACSGSRYPNGVIMNAGHLVGAALTGGRKGGGTVFEVAP